MFVNLKKKSVSDCDSTNILLEEKRSEMKKVSESIDCEIRNDKRRKGPVPLIHIGEKDKKRDSWEGKGFCMISTMLEQNIG